ncbi:MAG TPA: thiamine-phosphate kinase [Acetobacteraceae bacterium]|nr:thiamine-phosphate kinase [Acetobacteraceae bacterium]
MSGLPGAALPTEFSLIARHFRPLAGPGSLDLADDAAVLAVPPRRDLVISADAIVAGVHFLEGDPPDLVGRKLLRVNLSDLAAMGAAPLGYLLTLAAPRGAGEGWFASLAAGLGSDQAAFGLVLLGGDTTATDGPAVLSLTILGHVAHGQAVRRAGARPGHGVWVTGTIGDGALGLRALRGEVADPDGFLAGRYRLPRPRLGFPLAAAAAAMDVSDGLVQDLGHLCRAGDVAAEIDAAAVPLSAAAIAAGPEWLATCLTGGDDYELLLAIPPEREAQLAADAVRAGVPVTRIGRFVEGEPAVTVRDAAGAVMALDVGGWSHF